MVRGRESGRAGDDVFFARGETERRRLARAGKVDRTGPGAWPKGEDANADAGEAGIERPEMGKARES